MEHRKIPDLSDDKITKNKILDEATKLFAFKGFGAVSMRDIANVVGIKSSSIYNHYEGKDALIEGVLSRFETEYKNYFDWLIGVNAEATSLEQVVENMFMELKQVRAISTYYGIALVLKEQFHHESARKRVFKLFYEDSINTIQADFDRLIKKGIIPVSDSKTIATFFMCCVLIGNELRIHESLGYDLPINCTEMYDGLMKFIISALIKGL